MGRYEYKLAPTPSRQARFKDKKGDAFARTITETLNEIARDGWEFVGRETIAEHRRKGLFRVRRVARDFLVFRRALPDSTPSSEFSRDLRAEAGAANAPTASSRPLSIETLRARMAEASSGTPESA